MTAVSGQNTPEPPVEWAIERDPVPYPAALTAMDERVAAIRRGAAPELVWLLEHPPLYTAGTSADPAEMIDARGLPVYPTGRGGRYTYHGPGQRIVYAMLDLRRRGEDLRRYVQDLEAWAGLALGRFNIAAEARPDRIGLWVKRPGSAAIAGEAKIAALGVRVRGWVAFHGMAINVEPDLGRYAGIVPCGVRGFGVTSLADLGIPATLADLDVALRASFGEIFGRATVEAPSPLREAPARA